MDASSLSVEQRIELVRLANDLRQSAPVGVVGLLELRNLLGNMFPEFEAVRDEDIDQDLVNYIASLQADPVPLPTGGDSFKVARPVGENIT